MVSATARLHQTVEQRAARQMQEYRGTGNQIEVIGHETPRMPAGQPAPPMQNDLFASLPHPVIEELGRINPDNMTPRQALDLLYNLKTRV